MKLCSLVALIGLGAMRKEIDGQCSDGDCGDNTAQPIVPLNGSINSASDSAYTDRQRAENPYQTLDELIGIDAALFTTTHFRLDLRLVKYPIHAVRTDDMQPFDARDRDDRRVGLCRLECELRPVAIPCASARMLVGHASVPYACRRPQRQNRRAAFWHRSETRGNRCDTHAMAEQWLAPRQGPAECFSDDRPWIHDSKLFCPTDDSLSGSSLSARHRGTLAGTGRILPPFYPLAQHGHSTATAPASGVRGLTQS